MSAPPRQDTEALLRSILESSLDGIMAFRSIREPDGRIADFEWVLLNSRAANLLGRTPEALTGRRLLEEMPSHRADGLFDRYVRVVDSGQPLDLEHYIEQERAHLWLHSVAVKLGDGLAVTFADVTDRKGLEEQLLHSQKLEVVGRLAGGVAHDFNNLLTAISMNAEMALDHLPPSSPGRMEVDSVIDGVRRAAAITQQLLAFARRQPVTPRTVRVDDVVTHSVPMLRSLLGNAIELVLVPSDEPWAASLDPLKFEQVLTNLAVNAHDAMPQGGRLMIEIDNVTVHAGDSATLRRVRPGDYVRIEAEDTGTGIPQDVLPHIFEPFFTTKDAGRGTGLGLATSYGIIRQAGGMMWATSTPGRGATFTMLLPRVDARPEPWPRAVVTQRASSGTERVLVVDDEPAVRVVVSRTLSRLGYRIESAGHGEEALRMLEQSGDFDLVVSDIVMPRMGGRELQRASRLRFPDLPVLLMSGFESDATNAEGPLLKKPFTVADLANAVREALDGGQKSGQRSEVPR